MVQQKEIPALSQKDINRFWSKVNLTANDNLCWEWQAYRMKPCGHGRFSLNGETKLAHRIAYTLEYGEIPLGIVIRHKCNNASCCNPNHLIKGTQADNVEDMIQNKDEIKRPEHPLPIINRSWSNFREQSIEERFWVKVEKSEEGCWEWKAALFSNGYGHFQTKEKSHLSHRFAWELINGTIPDGMILLHSCDNNKCVRVSHLSLGTHADNTADMIKKGRNTVLTGENHPNYGNRNTHCNKGHEMTKENILWSNGGKVRRCRVCTNAANLISTVRYIDKDRDGYNARRREKRAALSMGRKTKITETQVKLIIEEYSSKNITQKELGSKYGITQTHIGYIVNGKSWKHLLPKENHFPKINYAFGYINQHATA